MLFLLFLIFCLLTSNIKSKISDGKLQDDLQGFSLAGFIFMHTTKGSSVETYGYSTLSFQTKTHEFNEIEFPKRSREILGSCYVTFDDENLVIKIGGEHVRRSYGKGIQSKVEVLKFSSYEAKFTLDPDLQVNFRYSEKAAKILPIFHSFFGIT